MEQQKIIYGPTIDDSQLANKITARMKKYKGMFTEQKELLVVTGKLKRKREATKEYVILNADSPQLKNLDQFIYGAQNIIYYSQFKDNLIIYVQVQQGQPVVYREDNNLFLFDGQESLPLVAINELKVQNVSTALFTIAAGFIAGLPLYIVRRVVKNIEV